MTLIDALLTLPRHGNPVVVSQHLATILAASPARFVRHHAPLWSLTHDGQRFLAQFRLGRSDAISRVAVKLVSESDGPVFHLVCDAGTVLRVRRTDLRRSLRDIQHDNPGVKIMFDFRSSGRMP